MYFLIKFVFVGKKCYICTKNAFPPYIYIYIYIYAAYSIIFVTVTIFSLICNGLYAKLDVML